MGRVGNGSLPGEETAVPPALLSPVHPLSLLGVARPGRGTRGALKQSLSAADHPVR